MKKLKGARLACPFVFSYIFYDDKTLYDTVKILTI